MVYQPPLLVVALAFVALPSLVNAALFPKKSSVKHLDTKGFRQALMEERTFVAAFVAPWCGHCQRLAPELIRAANSLHPLVPVYAVDCDDTQNKPLCAEQDVKGFPTIKLYPRGKIAPAIDFDGSRTASNIFYWVSAAVPRKILSAKSAKGIADIVAKNPGKPKAILMNKSNKTPLLWKVLSNNYRKDIIFGSCPDVEGKVSAELGFEAGTQSNSKVIVYGREHKPPVLYEGILKFGALSEFFDQVIEGTVNINRDSFNVKEELLDDPVAEAEDLDDETHARNAGVHEGLVKEEPGRGPDADGQSNAANPQTAGNDAAKVASGLIPTKSTTSLSQKSSSSKATSELSEPLSSMAKSSIAMDGSFSAKTGETAAKGTETATSAGPVLKGTEIVAEHTKDEL